MKAAILRTFGAPLSIEDLPDPAIGTGEIIVDVVASGVLPYAAQALANARNMLMELPMIPGPGAVGRVREAGPDATRLKVGDWVLCDTTVRSRDDALTPDIILQGLTARGEGGLRLQRHFHDGAWAQRMRVPTENAVPLGKIEPAEAPLWCATGLMLVPYGGLLASGLRPGETIVVGGATGNFGSAAVTVALAMGAGKVIAPGRNEAMLGELSRRFGTRIAPVRLTGDETNDLNAIREAADGPIDVMLDILPPSADVRVVRTAAMSVREFGRIVLMGGVGMLGGDDFGLPYPWIMRNGITVRGQWMYPRTAPASLLRLIRAGLIDLQQWETTSFGLDQANEAVEHAARSGGPFRMTVIAP
jgi:alcohol dehydrogenase